MTIIKMNQEYDKIALDAQDKKLAEVVFLMSDIMKNGHGRLVSAASFGVIDKFMSGIKDNGDKIDFSGIVDKMVAKKWLKALYYGL
ncbi:hypothetical protein DDU33_10230 [Actinobacillus porcitonsillarum]|uniref:Uncharacterized protein n=1 Tax=Actinobacillus porcitonsillarum TaxID=189834 RepID=A0A2U8FLG1_9PAST|nr:hypothetical protein [Actinobacillus porcitonsillarum]AWI51835.1 hypothetical protein DDU33_10230 [Actinobacillus porcitonsillarum]